MATWQSSRRRTGLTAMFMGLLLNLPADGGT
jgi:hypothetical protein